MSTVANVHRDDNHNPTRDWPAWTDQVRYRSEPARIRSRPLGSGQIAAGYCVDWDEVAGHWVVLGPEGQVDEADDYESAQQYRAEHVFWALFSELMSRAEDTDRATLERLLELV